MNLKALLFLTILSFTLAAIGCGRATTEKTVDPNLNTGVVMNNSNPVPSPGGGNSSAAAGNSNIPGIPNIPGTEKTISQADPTRTAKVQAVMRQAPDNSEITTSLGQDLVETRTFKNNAQIAKIEVIGMDKKTVKVYLRNGQVKDLPEGKVADPLSESAANILKVLAGGSAAPVKSESKSAAQAETSNIPKKPQK